MTGGPPRARRADAVRNAGAILDAGVAVLAEDPDAGLAAIARAAGTTRTTLYAHYPSREHLLDALVRRVMDGAAGRIDAALERPGTAPVDALHRVLLASWRALGEQRHVVAVARRVLGDARMAELHAPVRHRLLTVIESGRATGDLRTDLPAAWMLATYFALVHLADEHVRTGALDEPAALDALWTTLAGAFGIAHPPRS